MNHLLRQIADIQSQAAQIDSDNAASRVLTFSRFNDELIVFLKENINDYEIIKLVNEIPNLHEEIQTDRSISSFLIGLISQEASSYLQTKENSEETLYKIKEIKSKYASIESLLKNSHFSDF